jgi:hypothetical protein
LSNLEAAILALIKVSESWEKLEESPCEILTSSYPFDKDFEELILGFKTWKENIENEWEELK